MFRPCLFSLLSLLFLLPLAGGLRAQQAPQQMPPPLPPPVITGLPASPGSGGAVSTGAERADVRMLYSNAPISEILDRYEALTGKHIIADNTLQGSLSIQVNKFVTRSEAIRIIETSLNLNGFTLVQGAGDIVKVLGLGKSVRNAGVPIFSELAQVPDSDQTVSFLLRLRYIDAQQVQAMLQQYIPPNNSTAFTALPQSGALIITDTASSVRRLVGLLDLMDQPAAPVVQKFIRLERADATKAVEFLNAVFESKTSGQPGAAAGAAAAGAAGVRRPIRRVNEDGQPIFDPASPAQLTNPAVVAGLIALNGDAIIQGRIVLTPDVRTNRIHVVTQPVNLPLVERLVADYDSNTPFARPIRRPLRFVSAKDMLPILVQALTEPGAENNQNGGAANPNQPNRQNNQASNFTNNSNSSFGNNSSTGSGGGADLGASELNTEPIDTTPTEAVVGSTKIIADQRSNTIILLGGAEAKDKVFQILNELDVRAPQVIISAVIGEFSLNNNNEYGINYLLRRKGRAAFSQFNSSYASTGTGAGTTTGTTTVTDVQNTNASTLNTLTTLAAGLPTGFSGLAGIISITNSFDVILSALDASNRFKTISRPTIFTSNNKKALIASGQEIAVPGTSLSSLNGTTGSEAAVSTTVQYKEVVLKLEVVPLINSEREVTLDIVQTINSIVAGQNVTVGGNSIPTIATRKIKSYVSMPNGATVVLGGLISQGDSRTNSNVPLLSKIPLLGDLLFKTRTKDTTRSELIILLHPKVVNNPALLEDERQNEEDRLHLGPNLEAQLDPLPRPVRRALPVLQSK